jgi:hypothetical protein
MKLHDIVVLSGGQSIFKGPTISTIKGGHHVMAQFLWKLFEKTGSINTYLFYRALEDIKNERFTRRTVSETRKKDASNA